MAFKLVSSPHHLQHHSTSSMMRVVMLATVPGFLAQTYFFGFGTFFQILIAIATAIIAEGTIQHWRNRDAITTLKDNSAILTALLLALCIPPLAPWWVIVIGTSFSIIVAKQLYGGLGFNPFNPAMIGYVMLLISFPVEMTSWMPVAELRAHSLSFIDCLYVIFTGYSEQGFSLLQLRSGIDGITMATPLDTVKTDLTLGKTVSESMQGNIFGGLAGIGWQWVNLAYLAGGLWMLKKRVIRWHIPAAFLLSLFSFSALWFIFAPDQHPSPVFHLLSGAAMFGAFFILTDPVSASTTDKGRLIYGALVGLLVFVIRSFGGYPDAIAFSVVIANMAVPLIDYYTRPRTYGHAKGSE